MGRQLGRGSPMLADHVGRIANHARHGLARGRRASAIGVGVAHGPGRTPSAEARADLRADLGGERPQRPLPLPHGHRDRCRPRGGLGRRRAAVDRLDGPPCGRTVPPRLRHARLHARLRGSRSRPGRAAARARRGCRPRRRPRNAVARSRRLPPDRPAGRRRNACALRRRRPDAVRSQPVGGRARRLSGSAAPACA